jgi:hypothetical protein
LNEQEEIDYESSSVKKVESLVSESQNDIIYLQGKKYYLSDKNESLESSEELGETIYLRVQMENTIF